MVKRLAKTNATNLDESPPLRGIELLAWWSVAVMGLVAICCAASLAYFYATEPRSLASSAAKPNPNVEKSESPQSTSSANTTSRSDSFQSSPETSPRPSPWFSSNASTPSTPNEGPLLFSLACNAETKSIDFLGSVELGFAPNSPTLEVTDPATKLPGDAWLVFDGVNQAIELPSISKSEGTVSLIVKIPAGDETSIFFDSSQQRLTLRKNDKGLRWRVAAERKAAKIRLVDQTIDFDQWQHLLLTWKDGEEAILFLGGEIADRYAYSNEPSNSLDFGKVIIGRTRGPNGKYYVCKIAELKVFHRAKTVAEVKALHQQVTLDHPALFGITE